MTNKGQSGRGSKALPSRRRCSRAPRESAADGSPCAAGR
jgi:hypothetical protein